MGKFPRSCKQRVKTALLRRTRRTEGDGKTSEMAEGVVEPGSIIRLDSKSPTQQWLWIKLLSMTPEFTMAWSYLPVGWVGLRAIKSVRNDVTGGKKNWQCVIRDFARRTKANCVAVNWLLHKPEYFAFKEIGSWLARLNFFSHMIKFTGKLLRLSEPKPLLSVRFSQFLLVKLTINGNC